MRCVFTIEPHFQIHPKSFVIQPAEFNTSYSQTFDLYSDCITPVDIKKTIYDQRLFYIETSIEPAEDLFKLHVELTPLQNDYNKQRSISDQIQIILDDERSSEIIIPVFCHFDTEFDYTYQGNVIQIAEGQTSTVLVKITNTSKSLKITEIECELPHTYIIDRKGGEIELTVNVQPSHKGVYYKYLFIHTDHPIEKTLQIPLILKVG